MATNKGFIKDYQGNILLPITRGELILDSAGQMALTSALFEAGKSINGVQNAYGLIGAKELQMLKGGGDGQSIADVYEKLGYINTGIKVGSNVLSFYDADGDATPISFAAGEGIAIGTANNVITAALAEITVTNTDSAKTNYVVKSVAVDKYGRVTEVKNGLLTDAEIPAELTGKTLVNAVLNNATTHADLTASSSDSAVANKKYVDAKFDQVNQVATGALHFKGSLSNPTDAQNVLVAGNENAYYKATKDFLLSASLVQHNTQTENADGKIQVDKGDTLIVLLVDGSYKFVHVPAGDDITTISVKKDGVAYDGWGPFMDNVTFNYNAPLSVSVTGQQIDISIPAANNSTNGYLSSTDYTTIMNAVTNLGKTKYTETVTSTSAGAYKLGTITVGTQDYDVYGQNNTSAFSLEQNNNKNENPILKFVESGVGATTVQIILEGSNGIKAEKSGNTVKLTAANVVGTESQNYLEITNGYVFTAKFGSGASNNVTEGLVKYSDYIVTKEKAVNAISILAASQPIILSGSLLSAATDADGKTYKYGNTALVEAITLTI